jgi:hypothetical protein
MIPISLAGGQDPLKGAILAGNGRIWTALAPSANTYVLTLDSTQEGGVKWAAAPGSGSPNIAVGTTVSGGAAGSVLYEDSNQHLAAAGGVTSDGSNLIVSGNIAVTEAIGVFGVTPPASQPATPTTLAEVISLLQAYGLSA